MLSGLPAPIAAEGYPLVVDHRQNDDAAVVRVDSERGLVSTTDFFMPIVDDPFEFGWIAATNAMSDVYAMGGKPVVALSILGWPSQLAPELGREVVRGGIEACHAAGFPVAGGHSIDSPEPIFGLAVTGIVDLDQIKANNGAKAGHALVLTKRLGIGLYTTAQKRGGLAPEDLVSAITEMKTLNSCGIFSASLPGVGAQTDITGFGLGGHLLEVCKASKVSAVLNVEELPLLPRAMELAKAGFIPGGTQRNWKSIEGALVEPCSPVTGAIVGDPQTSGGLLISVEPSEVQALLEGLKGEGAEGRVVGHLEACDGEPAIQLVGSLD